MAWGKTEEEKAQEQLQQLEREKAQRAAAEQAQAARAAAAFAASPLGQATAAKKAGARFFQFEMAVSKLQGSSAWGSSDAQLQRGSAPPDLLGQIEDLGWRLEHVSHVFIETGATSTDRMFQTGEGTVIRGIVQGIYLFRATA